MEGLPSHLTALSFPIRPEPGGLDHRAPSGVGWWGSSSLISRPVAIALFSCRKNGTPSSNECHLTLLARRRRPRKWTRSSQRRPWPLTALPGDARALREFALGLEALHRFVEKEPLYRVQECVCGVLALESRPVDPRL